MGIDQSLPLVVSSGDPAGIGPDIILSAFSLRETLGVPPFYVVGDVSLLRERATMLGLQVDVRPVSDSGGVYSQFLQVLPVLEVPGLQAVVAGEISSSNGAFVIETIRRSVEELAAGRASGLVTAPIHKAALYEAGFQFPGHTEYLASLCPAYFQKTVTPVMMLASEELSVVPVTIHIPFETVPDVLTKDLIVETVSILAKDLQLKFGIRNPRIIVTGLNPHAGEDGTLGREEIDVIEPAVKKLQAAGVNVSGPFSADTCFHPRARQGYDAAVAMYHDQALIPIKTISFDEGVNVTLGLPFIRTSPDHGTAVDISGTGKAKADSFIAALTMASQMSRHYQSASVS